MSLIFGRRVGEKVIIDCDISVTVLRIERHHVLLAFDAPKDVAVDREEIWLKKMREVMQDD